MPPFLASLLANLPFFAYALLMILGARLFYGWTSDFSFGGELTDRDNPAFGVCLAGYLTGIAIAMTGAFPSSGAGFRDAAIVMTYSGVLAILLMRASIWINDKFILSRFSIRTEMIRDRNLGAGFAVAGSSLGTGLVLAGALTGESDGYLRAMRDIGVYWLVGQALFIGGAALFFKTAGYDVQKTLEEDNNAAAGISLGGFLASLGVLLYALLRNASGDLVGELGITVVLAVIGGPLLLAAGMVMEKLVLPKTNLAKEIALDKNTAAGAICAAASLSAALLLAAAILSRH